MTAQTYTPRRYTPDEERRLSGLWAERQTRAQAGEAGALSEGVALGRINVQGPAGHAVDTFPVVRRLDGPTLELLAEDERWALDTTHRIIQAAGSDRRTSMGAFGARTLDGAQVMDMAKPMRGVEPGVIEIVVTAPLAGG